MFSSFRLVHCQTIVWNSKLPSKTAKLPSKMQIVAQKYWSNCFVNALYQTESWPEFGSLLPATPSQSSPVPPPSAPAWKYSKQIRSMSNFFPFRLGLNYILIFQNKRERSNFSSLSNWIQLFAELIFSFLPSNNES